MRKLVELHYVILDARHPFWSEKLGDFREQWMIAPPPRLIAMATSLPRLPASDRLRSKFLIVRGTQSTKNMPG